MLMKKLDGKYEIQDAGWACQTMLLGLMFAAYNGEVGLFRRSFTLHSVLANVRLPRWS
jgi:hypothetical protein